MKKVKKDLLEKFMVEFIKDSDLSEDQDRVLFEVLRIIKSQSPDEEEVMNNIEAERRRFEKLKEKFEKTNDWVIP